MTQADKTLEAQPIQQLKLHLLVAEIVQLLQHDHSDHDFGRKRRATAFCLTRPRRRLINGLRQDFEVDVLFQYLQDVTQLIQFSFRFFCGK